MTVDRRRFMMAVAATAAAGAMPLAGEAATDSKRVPTKAEIFDDPEVAVIGNPKGDVALVEWFDYQCPFCKASFAETLAMVRADGRIRYLMKDWPILGEESVYAAKLTLAAGPARGKAMGALMTTRGRLTRDVIDGRLKGAGLDPATLTKAYYADAKRIDALVWRNGEQADAFGLYATPGYMIGTTLFPGALKPADMRRAVAEARRNAAG